MQAIVTRYIPATNTRDSRVKASCARGKIMIPYDGEQGEEMIHIKAASLLVARFATEDFAKYGTPHTENPWNRPRAIGELPSGGYCHVFLSDGLPFGYSPASRPPGQQHINET